MAYSKEFKEKVIAYIKAGHTQRETKAMFGISFGSINKWNQQYIKTGKFEDEKAPRRVRKLDPKKLRAYVECHPEAYLKDIGKEFGCSDTAVSNALKRYGIPRNKPAE